VGSAVTNFRVGDEVFGIGQGAFAEYAVAPAGKLIHRPAGLTAEQAAVIAISGSTALRAVTDIGRITAGQEVLVTGASGAVGSYAVQLAKAAGARVTGVCSTAKIDLVRSLGAEQVIDYTRDDFADGTRRYDVIVDIAGSPTLSRLRRALTPTGTAVLVGGEDSGNLTGMGRQLRGAALSPFIRQRFALVLPEERASHIERLTELVMAGTVTPSIGQTYPLDRVPEAMRQLEAGLAQGKTVITVG
jgi:NADPH:quinone reductase-like Zn-dependent oxidoreductase